MEIPVRVGDTVYYGKYSGTEIEVDGQKFVILRESDLLGVLVSPEASTRRVDGCSWPIRSPALSSSSHAIGTVAG